MVSFQDTLEKDENPIMQFPAECRHFEGQKMKVALKFSKYATIYLTNKRLFSLPASISKLFPSTKKAIRVSDIQSIKYNKILFKAGVLIKYYASAMTFSLRITGGRKNIDKLVEELKKLNSEIKIEL